MRRVYNVSSRVAFVALLTCLTALAFISKARAQSRRGEPSKTSDPAYLTTGYYVVDVDDDAPEPWRPEYNFMDTSYHRTEWTQVWTGPRQNAPHGMYFFDPTHINDPSAMDTINNCMAGPIFMRLGHPFSFYEGNYDSVYISSNGFIGFLPYSYATAGSPPNYAAYNNVHLTQSNISNAPRSIIAALWADLDMAHGTSPDDTSKVYFRTSPSLDTFMVNYYWFRLRPASPNFSPVGWGQGSDKIFCKKLQIILANTDSSIQINYGGFYGSINSFPPALAYQLFQDNVSIGVVNGTESQQPTESTSLLYHNNWDAINTECRPCNKDWLQNKQYAVKFKRWHNIVRAVKVNYPPNNYEICLGSSVTPGAEFMNVDSQAHTFKVRFSIRNVVTGIAVYSRVVSLVDVQPHAIVDTVFSPYATNPSILQQLGTFTAEAIATTYDTADSNIGDEWPFDDTTKIQVFGIRRTPVPYWDPSNNYAHTQQADIPDQDLWVSIGAQVVEGESSTWDPPPPSNPEGGGYGVSQYIDPVIQLDRADINGNEYNGSDVGDTLISFPLNLQGKTKANLSFDFQRAGKFNGYYSWLWDDATLYGPEATVTDLSGNVLQAGDSLAIDFKDPSAPGCNPAPSAWKEVAAIDGGGDFEYKKFFMNLSTGLVRIDGLPDKTIKLPDYFTADFRFRFRLKATNNNPFPPPNDDLDPWYIDNPSVLVPLKPEIEVMWVRIVNPYTKIPASQAVSLPVYVKIANLSTNVRLAFPVRVQIIDPNQHTVYWQAVTVDELQGQTDTVLTMPAWNAQDATAGDYQTYTAHAWLDQPGYDPNQQDDGTYSQFALGVDQSPGSVQEFAYDNGGMDPGHNVGNDLPSIWQGFTGMGAGFTSENGSFAMKFKLAVKDTLYGVRVYFASANQAPDAIRISILNGDPNSCTPGDTVLQEGVRSTMEAVRGGGSFDQWWPYYFPKPIVLPGGADGGATRGVYWASVSQLSLDDMMMGGNASRGGGIMREWDPMMITPVIEPAYDDPYGTQWSAQANNGDVSCAWAIEAVAGSGGWAEWEPSVGWWPTNSNYGTPFSNILDYPFAQNPAWMGAPFYQNTGSYSPMIRVMVSQEGLLPVKLVYLKGDTANGEAILTWATANEHDNAGFTIQRKRANSEDMFGAIGYVAAGSKNSSTEKGYGYIDQNVAPGTYDYRLLQTDVNGAQHASNEVQVTIAAPNDFTLGQNYPNPFSPVTGSTKLSYTVPASAPASLVIYNQLGQVVKTLVNGDAGMGSHSVQWDGTDETGAQVASGSYICKLISGEHSAAIKIIVSR